MEKSVNGKVRKEVIIIGDSMLSNFNSRGLSKSKKVDVLNFLEQQATTLSEKLMMF